MESEDLSHEQKDELIDLVKRALQLACARLACYEGLDSPTVRPEEWIGRAYLMLNVKGYNS